MRPALALVLVLLVLGSVQGFMMLQASLPNRSAPQFLLPEAEGTFAVEIGLTFRAEPDAFELEPLALLVRTSKNVLVRREEPVPVTEVIRLEDVEGIVPGMNELFVKAWSGGEPTSAHAIRVTILRDGQPIAQDILWAEPGEPVQGALHVEVPEYAPVDAHEH